MDVSAKSGFLTHLSTSSVERRELDLLQPLRYHKHAQQRPGTSLTYQVLCHCSRLSNKRQQRTSAECLRMSRRTSCICFQYVTILVICKPARPDLPKNKIAVFADRGRPDHFRYFVAFAWSRLTKVNVKSSAVRYHESLGMMKCWYSHNFEVFGRV